MELKDKKLYLLDMDGTLYLGDRLFPDTQRFLSMITARGGRYIVLTNNSAKGTDRYVDKLAGLGIASGPEDFCTSVHALIRDLSPRGYRKIYALGTASFRKQLSDAGFPVTDRPEAGIDCLCMGFDTELTFRKLEDASRLLLDPRVDYIATNPDWVCPTEFGYVPDCGSVAGMLYNATKRKPRFIGKPQPEMIWLAIEQAGCTKEETVVFGDRLYTDIKSGVNAGVTTCFVLSGEGTLEDLETSDARPDYVFRDVGAYTDYILHGSPEPVRIF